MIDLVEMKALVWDSDDKDAEWQVLDVTPDLADKLGITVPSDRQILAAARSTAPNCSTPASSMDDAAMEAYLEGTSPPRDCARPACARAR
jgi:elongation factor G